MPFLSKVDASYLIGRSPEGLNLEEREALAGKFIALQIYSSRTLPLRRIEAFGDSAEDCIQELAARGLNPRDYEFIRLPAL